MPRSDTQFQPGTSGNPGGRPRAKPITDRLRVKIEEIGEDECSFADAIVDQWLSMIADGDSGALKELVARLEGRTPLTIELDGDVRLEHTTDPDLPSILKALGYVLETAPGHLQPARTGGGIEPRAPDETAASGTIGFGARQVCEADRSETVAPVTNPDAAKAWKIRDGEL
jgi:hypothetical protein